MTSIQGDIAEVKSLTIELKKQRAIVKQLNQQKKAAEQRIIDYIQSKEQDGMKYNGEAIRVMDKKKRATKKKKDQEEDALTVLRENGIRNPDTVLKQLLESRRGDEIDEFKLNFAKK
jgi:hypothetical protein